MDSWRRCLWVLGITLGVSLLAWGLFSWPLPLHVSEAVPLSAKDTEANGIRRMVEGDHLQLMYHFWLFDDMLKGQTPWFHNVYEFNLGDDAARYHFSSYYVPFSLFFSMGYGIGGRACGWNLAGFLAVWISYWLSWLLARRYTREGWLAWVAAAIMLIFPFRWISLLGGSPMGYAMMWSPLLILGLDMAVRDERIWGGVLAGLAILFACWSDTHLFFFGVLLVPAYCLLAFLYRSDFRWSEWRGYARLVVALVPVPLLLVAAMRSSGSARRAAEEGGGEALGRTWEEVGLYSPTWNGLFDGSIASTTTSHIYTGMAIWLLLLCGLIALAVWLLLRAKRARSEAGWWRPVVMYGLIVVGILVIVGLSLGVHGPFGGKMLLAARKFIGPYRMIRQPAKIFCLLPPLLVVATVLAHRFLALAMGRCAAGVVTLLLILFSTVEAWNRIDASLTFIDRGQGAYAAVAADAQARGQARPSVLVLPLWPGDSHYGSAYEHYASIYRLRMVNGYSPVLPDGYLDGVFWYYESANQGVLSDEQLAGLTKMGVEYLLFHENMFPEKVSPFPVGQTLQNLLNHPRLARLGREESVWAFRIEPAPEAAREPVSLSPYLFPARRWELERTPSTNAISIFGCKDASGEGFVRLDTDGARSLPRGVRLQDAGDSTVWMLRARGAGALAFEHLVDGVTNMTERLDVASNGWQWLTIPAAAAPTYRRLDCALARLEGMIELDQLLLTQGDWNPLFEPAEIRRMPAAMFFHAGYTADDLTSVTLRKERDPVAIVFYGPMLPFAPGEYEVELRFESDAPAGTDLGWFDIRRPIGEERPKTPVVAGASARYRFTHEENLPLYLAFVFSRNADVTIREVVFRCCGESGE